MTAAGTTILSRGPSGRGFRPRITMPAAKAACIVEIQEVSHPPPAAPLVIIKELRITVLSSLRIEAARLAGLDVAAVIAVCHPQEVAASLAARDQATPELLKCLVAEIHRYHARCITQRNTRQPRSDTGLTHSPLSS